MHRSALLILATSLTLGAQGTPIWSVYGGAIRATDLPAEGAKGPLVGLAWMKAFTQRQGLRLWADASALRHDMDALVYRPGGTPTPWGPYELTRLTYKQQALSLGADYRFSFMKRATTPYLTMGVHGGLLHVQETFSDLVPPVEQSEHRVRGGLTFGVGMTFSRRVEAEVRFRNYEGRAEADVHTFTLAWRL